MKKDKETRFQNENGEVNSEYMEPVLKLFYRTRLRKEEKVIDNRSTTIAKELGISPKTVTDILDIHLNEKFKRLHEKHKVLRKTF